MNSFLLPDYLLKGKRQFEKGIVNISRVQLPVIYGRYYLTVATMVLWVLQSLSYPLICFLTRMYGIFGVDVPAELWNPTINCSVYFDPL